MRKVFASLLVFVCAFFLFSVTPASANVLTSEKGVVSIAKTEVVNDDLFVGAQTAEIDGTVNGDVFIGAQTVKITGTVNGNVHVGANLFVLDGNVKGNVYAGAQSVLVSSSTIDGSLVVGAATVNIDKDTTIGGSILAGAGTLSIDSQVKRSVYAGAGSLTIGSDAKVGKDLYYAASEGQTTISDGAKITGSVYKSEVKNVPSKVPTDVNAVKKQASAAFAKFKTVTTIISFVGALVVGFICLKLFGKQFTQAASLISQSFWKVVGVGFLTAIALIPGLLILLITVIGIPLAGLVFLMFLVYTYLAKIAVGVAVGNWVVQRLNWKVSTYGALALGLLAIYLVAAIPVLGFFSGLVVLWVGLGSLVLLTFSKSE